MHTRKSVLFLMMVVVMIFSTIMNGCAPAPATPETSQPPADEPAQPTGEKVKIVYWSMFSE